MGPSTTTRFRRAREIGAGVFIGTLSVLVAPARSAGAAPGCTPVLGPATTTPAQLAGWFATTGHQPKLDVSILTLATVFVEEGAREGVRGDIAFAQAIVETGYFGFSPSVPPAFHNYSGIGATGGSVRGVAFADARVGVRAQVQHLRAYADPRLRSAADLKAPLVDPRFGFLVPNPRTVPCWEQFGNGVWAADPTGYGPRVLSVHQRMAAFPVPVAAAPPTTAPAIPVAPAPEAVAPIAEPPVTEAETMAPEMPPPSYPDAGPSRVVDKPALASAGGTASPARNVAGVFVGLGLLSICSTLWWHGRRFARAT